MSDDRMNKDAGPDWPSPTSIDDLNENEIMVDFNTNCQNGILPAKITHKVKSFSKVISEFDHNK